ncbi:ferritin-like domain-containing protein [Candidatus Methylospira mobilis]|uniref:Ferritin-like domain-containing protein n=1 Tax=Candidatus Methylospira mobilis TaxID=1808979 RepID=A0A5Q0BIK4_9GAMM|nr:ferritin-like domain-containing protein [Candidatus Methylospira mobilis]QFY42942.1 ferritin-like domain-containing protein [Candidatus Methylospira mobilis]WNV03816.1 ferritin-like domain-containing protein [Candidatus Methylospira mobilis]
MSRVNIFDLAEQVLQVAEIDAKLDLTLQAASCLQTGGLTLDRRNPLPINRVVLPQRPELVDPRYLARRRLNTLAGRIALLHAVAHIEFIAILLAWDHVYRFSGMPEAYYLDWAGVAIEEARHFSMIRARLRSLDADYGDLPAHGGLWSIAVETFGDVLARMALVPRFMEARGLDVTPAMIARLNAVGDEASVEILRVILREEVGHVALGSKWFAYVCGERDLPLEASYFNLLGRYMKGAPRGPYNAELRLQAGFSQSELDTLAGLQ